MAPFPSHSERASRWFSRNATAFVPAEWPFLGFGLEIFAETNLNALRGSSPLQQTSEQARSKYSMVADSVQSQNRKGFRFALST